MEKLQKATFWTLILSESTHVLCCVLPTLVSIISLLSGAGALAYLPADILRVHDFLHHWEVPMIWFSAATLSLGWCLHYLSNRMNCVETSHCCHTPCAPKKTMTFKIMIVATALFAVNVAVYFIFHAGKTDF